MPVLLWAGASAANPASSNADLVLQGSIAARCEFNGAPSQISLNAESGATATSPLNFGCNLANAQPINVTISSAYGALKRTAGDAGLPYALSWKIGNETPFANYTPGTEPLTVSIEGASIGAGKTGLLTITLQSPASPVEAGTYSDQITFTLSP